MSKEEKNKKDRDVDDKTKKFVSDNYAEANPDTTTSIPVKRDPLKKWFKRLAKDGGFIAFQGEILQQGEVFEAYGYTFVYVPEIPEDRMSSQDTRDVFRQE